jgi:hypothetical protein
MSYIWYYYDAYLWPGSDQSLQDLAATGTNWVSLVVMWYQTSYTGSAITPNPIYTATDEALVHAIETIHALGMKVMLKPHIDLIIGGEYRDDRENIAASNVTAWFQNYRTFILHYAKLASSTHVEQFSVGTELTSMSVYTQEWSDTIDAVRGVYNRTLTYAAYSASTDEWKHIQFWNKLDYVGIDAYFTLADHVNATVDELRNAWMPYVAEIEAFQASVGKPIIFTEIGVASVAGANTGTWKWDNICNQNDSQYDPNKCKPDQQEQADFYESALETFWNEAWLQGIFWWTWMPYGTHTGWGEGGANDPHYSPHNKLAEQILRSWYAKPFIPEGTTPEAVLALGAIQRAENATATAMREGRMLGLDEANSLLSQAIDSYNHGDFTQSETFAVDAVKSADQSTIPQVSTTSSTYVPITNYTFEMLPQPVVPNGSNMIYALVAIVAVAALAISVVALKRNKKER